jgi:hypothetical protein
MMRRCQHTFDIRELEPIMFKPTPSRALLMLLYAMLFRMIMAGFSYGSFVETLVCIYASVFLYHYGDWIYQKSELLLMNCKKRFRSDD